ncbi:MAG: DNA primase [Chloroflexota bacterium]|nr:DNA primase [Chloroflexota bacterium]
MARDAVGDVRDRTDIVDLIGQYVDLKKTGRSFKGLCPFHQEKTPSFIVFPDSGNFHCFGCGRGGDAFTFYMDVERVEFREALQELAKRAGVELRSVPTVAPEEDARRRHLIEINEVAARFYAHVLDKSQAGTPGRTVMAERAVSDEMRTRFGLGYAPEGWSHLLDHLRTRGVDPAMAVEAGLLSERDGGGYYDKFRGRLMFPIRDRDGQTVGFGGRIVGEGQPKYLNSPQTPVFDKRSLLYALDLAKDAIRQRDQAVIVEGYMDAIAAHQFGHANVVAAMGTALTEAQVAAVSRHSRHIVLALDADTAGQMAMLRGIETMRETLDHDEVPVPDARGVIHFERRLKAHISVARLPSGKDPDELIRRDPERWPSVVATARPFIDFMIELLTEGIDPGDAARKSAVLAELAPVLRSLPDRVVQAHHIGTVARRLSLDERVVLGEVRRPSTSGTVASRPGPSMTSTRRTAESHLMALLLRHRTQTAEVAARVPDQDILDARNRELLRVLRDPEIASLDAEAIVAGLDDELGDHAESLLSALGQDPGQAAAHARKEAEQALLTLGRERLSTLMRHLQASIREAQESQEADGMASLSGQIAALYDRHRRFYPPPSPYFRDIRDEPTAR